MAKANPFAAIVKRLDSLQVKAENLRKEIKDLSIMVMAQSKKAQTVLPAKKKTVKKAAKKPVRKASAKKAVKKAKESSSLTVFRKSPVKKAKPRKR